MEKNIQQEQNSDKTFKIQETAPLQKPRRLLFLWPLLIGIIGFVLLFWCTRNYGVGLSGDSIDYIAWARNLIENHSFSKPDGSHLAVWPPLYPTLIACFKLCRIDDFLAVRLISNISFGLIIFLSGLLMLKYSGSLTISIICSLAALLSNPLVMVCSYAWSEPIFILLMMVFLLLVTDVINKPTFKSTLLLAAVTSAICLTRYIGVVFLPVGAIVLFCGIKHFRKKFIFTIFWGIVSVLLPGIWILRNWILTGTLTDIRAVAKVKFSENIQLMGNVIGAWFTPLQPKNSVFGWLSFILLCALILAIFVFIAYRIIKSKEFDWLLITASLFIFLYLATIVYIVTKIGMDLLGDRLLSPVYPAIVICLGIFLTKLLQTDFKFSQTENHPSQRIMLYGFLAGIAAGLWLEPGFDYTVTICRQSSSEGFGFANTSWKNSKIIAWLKANRPKGRIYSDEPRVISLLTDINAYMVPTKLNYFKNSDQSPVRGEGTQLAEFKSVLESKEDVYLVWFFKNFREYIYNIPQLQGFCNMKVIEKFDDGVVVALYLKEPSDSNAQ
jgi:hypothetical protein